MEVSEIPLRIRSVMLYDDDEESIRDIVTAQCQDAMSRIYDILSGGSDFVFKRLQYIYFHISFNAHNMLGNIGADGSEDEEVQNTTAPSAAQIRKRRLFGPRTEFHLNSQGAFVLKRHLMSVCCQTDRCFQYCLGMYAKGVAVVKPALQRLRQTDAAYQEFKNGLIEAAQAKFDLSNVTAPTSLHQIHSFQRKNKMVSLNVYGLRVNIPKRRYSSRPRPRNNYSIFPVRISPYNNDHSEEKKINLVITGSRNKSGFYHLALVFDFHALMRATLNHYSVLKWFCYICCKGFSTRREAICHQTLCDSDLPKLTFPSIQEREVFQPKTKYSPVQFCIAGDFETSLMPSDVSFGPLSRTKGEFVPLLGGYLLKFLRHRDIFPPTLPRFISGTDCAEQMWRFLRFDVFWASAIINQQYLPVRRLTESERRAIATCNTCSLCFRGISTGNAVLHHDHADGTPISVVCARLGLVLQFY